MSTKKTSVTVILLAILKAFMEITGLPAALLGRIHFADVDPIYFTLMINFVFTGMVCFLFSCFINKKWCFGLQAKGTLNGLKRFGFPAAAATLLVLTAFYIGLAPFKGSPSIWKVVLEGIVYYIGVGMIEELYLRGLLQNIIECWFGKRKNAGLYAILITSVLFGLGHIFGAMGQPVFTMICKVIWAAALGVYLGAVYFCTRNLWVAVLLHTLLDFCGIPFCFSSINTYPPIALAACLTAYLLLGCYGIFILLRFPSLNLPQKTFDRI